MNIIFRSYIYDALYIMADQLIKKHNPCQIHKDTLGKAHCLRDSPCCDGCKFLGPAGCTTKCLGCKLGLCSTAIDANPKLHKALCKMRGIARDYAILNIRISRKEALDHSKHWQTYNPVLANTISSLKAILEKNGGN